MEMRTRIQENRFGQALGYAWGVRDYSGDLRDLTLDAAAFATYFSMLEEMNKTHQPAIQDAYRTFKEMSTAEQTTLYRQWQRRPWSMYEEMRNAH